jgi:PhnB protein
MSQLRADPYINFQGKAREALQFYQKALGGKLDLLAFDRNGAPHPAGPDEGIMHARLESDGLVIMGSDGMPEYPPKVGENIAIALSGEDEERLTKAFAALSEDGNVKQALKVESWGDAFGWFEDKYGINWMVNINKPKA